MSKQEYYAPAPPNYSSQQNSGYSNYGNSQHQQNYQPQNYQQQGYQQQPQYYPQQQQQPVYVQHNNNNSEGFHPGSNSWNWCCGLLNLAMCLEMLGVLISVCV